MGNLEIGDYVLGSDGMPTKVILKSNVHSRPCYKVTLSDNSEVICDNVHLWDVDYVSPRYKADYHAILTADELYSRMTNLKARDLQGTFVIKNPKPLDLPKKELPIDPWLLGAWLGDGHRKTGSITVGAQDIDNMKELLMTHWGAISVIKDTDRDVFTVTCTKSNKNSCFKNHEYANVEFGKYCRVCQNIRKNPHTNFKYDGPEDNVPLSKLLRKNGLLYNKHIPQEYIRSSYDQRLELLRGLMDTDGSWNPLRKRCVFVSAVEGLADSVAELIRTFGVTVQRFTATDKLGNVSYRIEFRPTGFNPFKLTRKAEAVKSSLGDNWNVGIMSMRRTIKSVVPTDSVPTQCLGVDSKDSLY
jgi:hypothetical protein